MVKGIKFMASNRLTTLVLILSFSLSSSSLAQKAKDQAASKYQRQQAKSNATKSHENQENQIMKQIKPHKFNDFAACVGWVKKSVYLIVRGRPLTVENKIYYQWKTLGSGFIAAPYRLLTASHVIDNPEIKDDSAHHKEGDIYYLLRNDGDDYAHWRMFKRTLNQDLFLYPEIDLAVMYLDEEFYQSGKDTGLTKNHYLAIDEKFLPLGSSVGVIGYPLAELLFADQDITKPLAGNIFLRTDTGVINTRYKTQQGPLVYEFTMMFNPGNSGGPIFNPKTCQAISLVKGYRSVPIKTEEKIISDEGAKQLKIYKEKAYIEVTHSAYSVGYATATPSIIDAFKRHNIIK